MSTQLETQAPTANGDEPINFDGSVPEAPAPDGAGSTAGDEPAPGTESGTAQPRDPHGRFAPKSSADAPAATPPAEGTPAPAPLPGTAPAPAVAAPPPADRPFAVRSRGQQHAIEGAVIDAQGWLKVPPQSQGLVKQLLAEGLEHRQTFRQRETEFQQRLEEATQRGSAEAGQWRGLFEQVYTILKDPEHLAQLALEYDLRFPVLKDRLDLMFERSGMQIPKAPEPGPKDPAAEQQALEQRAMQVFDEELTDLLEDPKYAAVFTGDERKALEGRMGQRWTSYFTTHEGQTVLDTHALREELDYEASLRTRAKTQAAELAQAAAKNAAKPPQVPSIVPARGSPSPSDARPPVDKAKWAREHGFG